MLGMLNVPTPPHLRDDGAGRSSEKLVLKRLSPGARPAKPPARSARGIRAAARREIPAVRSTLCLQPLRLTARTCLRPAHAVPPTMSCPFPTGDSRLHLSGSLSLRRHRAACSSDTGRRGARRSGRADSRRGGLPVPVVCAPVAGGGTAPADAVGGTCAAVAGGGTTAGDPAAAGGTAAVAGGTAVAPVG